MTKGQSEGPVRRSVRAVKRAVKKTSRYAVKSQEDGARKAVLEQLFYDFNQSRTQIFWMNFFRGIFFGVGSVIGATIVVALLVSILSFFADLPGVLGDFIRFIVDTVNVSERR